MVFQKNILIKTRLNIIYHFCKIFRVYLKFLNAAFVETINNIKYIS